MMSQPSEEERAHGRITMKTYYKYFTTERGHLFTLLMVVTFILTEVRKHSLVLCTWISHVHGYYPVCSILLFVQLRYFGVCVCDSKTFVTHIHIQVKYLHIYMYFHTAYLNNS